MNEGDIAIAYHTMDDTIRDITKDEKNIEIFSLCTRAPERPPIMGADGVLNRNLQYELQYDCTAQQLQYETHSELFNDEQKNVFQTIIRDFERYQLNIGPAKTISPIFFIDAPGGYWKTFVLNTIAAYLRAKRKLVLANSSCGIAAFLLAGGRTAHVRFKIPLKFLSDTDCAVTASLGCRKDNYCIRYDNMG